MHASGRERSALRVFLVFLLIGPGAAKGQSSQEVAGPRDAMITALGAPAFHPSLENQAGIFDRLVGTWDCDYAFYLEDGSVRHSRGELLLGWILDGRALQDVWVTYPSGSQGDRALGTSVRYFDTAINQWRVVFMSPQFNYVIEVRGGQEGDRIVLRGVDAEGFHIRWSFNEIQPEAFTWRGERSGDGGRTWKLEEEHHMRRRLSGF